MRGNPALPGSPLKSKPTWLSTFGCLATSAFFCSRRSPWSGRMVFYRKAQRHVKNPMAAFGHGVAGDEPTAGGNGTQARPFCHERSDAACRQRLSLLNLWEDGNNLYVEAELPDLEVSDLEILVKGDNELSIKGQRKQPELGKGTWHRRERGHGEFSRVGELPQYVDGEKVTAGFKHGVLTITLPKRKEAVARRIEAKAT
jgi:HSP20 family protein